MAHYLLFFDKCTSGRQALLVDAGLASLCDRQPHWFDVPNGPDGKAGVACTWSIRGAQILADYSTEDVRWDPSPCGTYWVGVHERKPITPTDLERDKMVDGASALLADGNQWIVPVPRLMPHRFGMSTTTGQWERIIAREHKDYADLVTKYALQFFNEVDKLDLFKQLNPNTELPSDWKTEITIVDGILLVVRALEINYRLNDVLISTLGLLDDASMERVVCAAIELPLYREVEAQKKTLPSPVGIPVGSSM